MIQTLFGRLLIANLLLLGLLFGVISLMTVALFEQNLHRDKEQQLKLQNYIMLSSAIIRNQTVTVEDELREARFEDYESGLYGYITNQAGEVLWRTYSAHSMEVPSESLVSSSHNKGDAEFLIDTQFFRYHYTVFWEVVDDKPEALTFTVLEDRRPTLAATSAFKQHLWLWLAGIGVILFLSQLAVLRWSIFPLKKLAAELKGVEQGEKSGIKGRYPRELRRLVRNLNQLLATEKSQRERYHNTLADLAHSLKTPLAVIQTEVETSDQRSPILADQISRMGEIINHQLQRSVLASPAKLGEKNSIEEVVSRLNKALDKVYADKGIGFSQDIQGSPYFKGDKRDITEVLGNLLDNACKYCQSRVLVSAEVKGNTLLIGVHDDGYGIDPAHSEQLLERGLRADSRHAGQGLGLDVSRDIINTYQGELSIENSPLGGALFLVKLPM